MKAPAVFELMTYRFALTQCPTPKGNNIGKEKYCTIKLDFIVYF